MNDNDPTLDQDIEIISEHGCGRFIRVDAYGWDYDDDEYYRQYSGYLIFHPDVSMSQIQCRMEDALDWNARFVVSWSL